MTRLTLLAALFFTLASHAGAEDMSADVRVATTASGVRAEITLSSEVRELTFAYSSDDDQAQTWTLEPATLRLAGGRVTAEDGQPFRAFAIDIAPHHTPGAAIYPPLVRLGERGKVLYAPYLVANGARTTFHLALGENEVVLGTPGGVTTWTVPPKPARAAWRGERYLFLGPGTHVGEIIGARTVIAPETPAWLRTQIEDVAERAIAFYASALGPLRERPTILVALWQDPKLTPEQNARVRNSGGNVTEGGMIALLFEGGAWHSRSDVLSQTADHLVAHEIAHLWNSHQNGLVGDKRTASWLHEGAADYWARLVLVPDARARDAEVVERLNLCSAGLRGEGLLTLRHRSGVEYYCGDVVQWLVDLGVRKASKGTRTAFDVWRPLLDFAETPARLYSVHDVLGAAEKAAPAARVLLRRVLHRGGTARWRALSAELTAFGVRLVEGQQPSIRPRRYLLRHLMSLVCEERPHGLVDARDESLLDTRDHCGVLSGNPRVSYAEGRSLFTEADAALEAVARKCRVRGLVTLSKKTGETVATLRCTKPMTPLPPFFVLAPEGG
jgi:hypothetical protein